MWIGGSRRPVSRPGSTLNPGKLMEALSIVAIKNITIPTILIDTREQNPLFVDKIGDPNFPNLKIEWGTLKTGDYSIKFMSDPAIHQHSICIERKSIDDLFGSTGRGRERLEKEFIRMTEFDHAEFVIERDLRDIFCNPPPLSIIKSKSVYRTILAFSQRYNVKVWPCPNRQFLEKHVYLTLQRFYLDRQIGGCLEFSKL